MPFTNTDTVDYDAMFSSEDEAPDSPASTPVGSAFAAPIGVVDSNGQVDYDQSSDEDDDNTTLAEQARHQAFTDNADQLSNTWHSHAQRDQAAMHAELHADHPDAFDFTRSRPAGLGRGREFMRRGIFSDSSDDECDEYDDYASDASEASEASQADHSGSDSDSDSDGTDLCYSDADEMDAREDAAFEHHAYLVESSGDEYDSDGDEPDNCLRVCTEPGNAFNPASHVGSAYLPCVLD